ncbi:MAG: DUF2062 domain-containing protein [Vicinamibacterales bacterium]
MIHLTRALIRRWLDALLHVNDSPHRTAMAYAMGVFLGFSPFLGLHTVIAIVLAFVLNLNRVAVLLGVYSNLPWIMGGYYAFATAGGAVLMRAKLPPDLGERLGGLLSLSFQSPTFWQEVTRLLLPFLWPFTLGSLIGAAILAVIAYRGALAFVSHRRRHWTPDEPSGGYNS